MLRLEGALQAGITAGTTGRPLPQNGIVRSGTPAGPGIGADRPCSLEETAGCDPAAAGMRECRLTSDRLGVPDTRSGGDSLERR